MTRPNPPWDRLPGARVPFDWRSFFKKQRLMIREGQPVEAVAGHVAFRIALHSIAQAGWAADELFARGWRDAAFRGPLFILGHQRSGTTFLHRLLATDRTHFAALTFQEMLLPATSIQRGFAALGRLDDRMGGRARARFHRLQERLFGPLDAIHRLRFDEIEEDEFVLWAIYASTMCANNSPQSTACEELADLRDYEGWTEARKATALGWYRACLLKKAHRAPVSENGPPYLLSKNPAFSQKIPDLLSVFPDALLVRLVRDPLEAIPSRLSLIRAIWRRRFPGFDSMTPEQIRTILEDSARIYRYAERDLRDVPDERKLEIAYKDLTGRPRETVARLFDHFRLPDPDPALAAAIARLGPREQQAVSAHRYSLAEFHLDEKAVFDALDAASS